MTFCNQHCFVAAKKQQSTSDDPSFDLFADDYPNENLTPAANATPSVASPNFKSPPRKTRRQNPPRPPLADIVFASQSFSQARRAIEEINLNETAAEFEFSNSPVLKKSASPGCFAKSPWNLLEGPPRRDSTAAKEFYSWATTIENLHQRYETPIKPSHTDLKKCLSPNLLVCFAPTRSG